MERLLRFYTVLLPLVLAGCGGGTVESDGDYEIVTTMHIEYDHQQSFDVFFRLEGMEDLMNAFANAGSGVDLWDDGEFIPDEEIDYTLSNLEEYSETYRDDSTNYSMHLLGVQAARNHPTVLGTSEEGGGPGSWSFVFVQTIEYHPNVDDVDNMIERVTIHELGHQRANLTEANEHPELHNSSDCVMYNTAVADTHPQFCNNCQQAISAVSW